MITVSELKAHRGYKTGEITINGQMTVVELFHHVIKHLNGLGVNLKTPINFDVKGRALVVKRVQQTVIITYKDYTLFFPCNTNNHLLT